MFGSANSLHQISFNLLSSALIVLYSSINLHVVLCNTVLFLCQAVCCVVVGKIYAVNLYKAVMRFFRAVTSNIAVDAPPSVTEGPRLHLALQPMHPAYSDIVFCPVVRLCIPLQLHSGDALTRERWPQGNMLLTLLAQICTLGAFSSECPGRDLFVRFSINCSRCCCIVHRHICHRQTLLHGLQCSPTYGCLGFSSYDTDDCIHSLVCMKHMRNGCPKPGHPHL